jgi:hypothetical protein
VFLVFINMKTIIENRGTGSDFDLQDDTPANLTDLFLKLRLDFGTPEVVLLLIRSEIETISTQISTTTSKSITTYCENIAISFFPNFNMGRSMTLSTLHLKMSFDF